jgi:hypothetical protein
VVGLSSCLALALFAGLAWWLLRDDSYTAPVPDRPVASAEPDGAADALAGLVEAVRTGDEAEARALAPAGDAATAEALAGVVANADAARVADVDLRYVDELGAVGDDGAWSAAVDATWQFAGFDPGPAHTEVRVGFVPDGGGVAITGIGGGGDRSPLWLTGPVQVRRDADSLVLVDGPPALADRYAALADGAVPTVHRVLQGWRPRLVVEVPGSAGALDDTLGAEHGEYAAIAAVTSSVDGSLAPGAPVHVFVNPDVFGRLEPRGARVVMAHEATHVATGAATADVPVWLLEGFADYVALRDVRLPLSVTARQIGEQVRREGVPDALPGQAEFDTTTPHLGASYEAAWLACRLVATTAGEDALLAVYRRVSAGEPLGRVLVQETGLTEAQLTARWQDLLRGLA